MRRLPRIRWNPALWFGAVFLAISSLTRLALIVLHFGEVASSWYYIPVSLIVGTAFDLYVGLYVTFPLVVFMLLFPARWRETRWFRWPLSGAAWLFTFGLLYLGVTELFFFDEFNSRFNYVAVDYLVYPHEVFVNLWDTYPVLSVLIASALLALAFTWLTRRSRRQAMSFPRARMGALKWAAGYLVLIAAGLAGLNIDSTRICDNRALNEITGNGIYSFAHAGITNELDYNRYYARIDRDEAVHELRRLIADSDAVFLQPDTAEAIDRFVESENPLRRFNIVVVLEESFGSNFVGRLHPDGPCLTPQFDRVSREHGLLFRHIYATGNRTVRGIEATLASFPPIPGRSIVKRPGSEHVFTISSVLREMGYHTVFVYGGMSYFDNIGGFAKNNGYDRVIDRLDFKDPSFTTIWGVCDEEMFAKSIATFDSLHALGGPFFATLLTVSNHTPYTYPAGRIPFDPEDRTRDNAVRYADYAIGRFIDDARSHDFFDSTLFVFVADHGARVYGSQQIPMASYEIPLLLYNPVLYPTGATCDVTGSQMDIAPTILDVLGIDYESEFFGRSLLATPPDEQRVLMSHNRDVSLLRDTLIAVLGIEGNRSLWHVDPDTYQFRPTESPRDSSLVTDAISIYMTAYDMYRDHRLHPLRQRTIVR